MSSSKSPCAACKCLRRKCTQECVFAPYFPPDQPQKFAKVHKVFGASNVSKLLNELSVTHREDAVNSLEYEAETRLHDPVYGCVGLISVLQQRLKLVQQDLFNAKKELANYIGHQAMLPLLPHPGMMHHHHHHHQQYNMQIQQQMMGMPPGGGDMAVHHQQAVEAHQMAAVIAAREHHHHQQHQQQHHQQHQQQQQTEILRTYDFNGGFDNGTVINSESNGYNQMSDVSMSASLALGSYNDNGYGVGGGGGQIHQQTHHDDNDLQIQIQPQIMIQQQMVDQKPPRDGSEEGVSAC